MEKEIFVTVDSTVASVGLRGGEDIGGGFGAAAAGTGIKLIAVSADALREQFTNLIEVVEHVFDRATTVISLDQIELSIEITAEGKVSLLGSGATGGGRGAIKATFKRRVESTPAVVKV